MKDVDGRRRRRRGLSAAILTLVVVIAALSASYASAAEYNYTGTNLPGGVWTTGNGTHLPNLFVERGWANTTSSVCLGPVTHDASGFHFPYGWACNPPTWERFFPEINAAPGILNPNPGTIGKFEVRSLG
jgi:hypothetical protein